MQYNVFKKPFNPPPYLNIDRVNPGLLYSLINNLKKKCVYLLIQTL